MHGRWLWIYVSNLLVSCQECCGHNDKFAPLVIMWWESRNIHARSIDRHSLWAGVSQEISEESPIMHVWSDGYHHNYSINMRLTAWIDPFSCLILTNSFFNSSWLLNRSSQKSLTQLFSWTSFFTKFVTTIMRSLRQRWVIPRTAILAVRLRLMVNTIFLCG